MSADNQQERLDNNWLSGFVDGEGCFHVSVNEQHRMTLGFQVLPEFRLVQHVRDKDLLEAIQKKFCFGVVRKNHGDRWEWRVRSIKDLTTLCEFFSLFPLRTKKRNDFLLFNEVIALMREGKHLEREGIERIKVLKGGMNRQQQPLSRILRDYMPETPT